MQSSDIKQYKEAGYVLYKGFFNPSDIKIIKKEAQSVFINQMLSKKILRDQIPAEPDFENGMVRLFNEHFNTFSNCGKQAQHLISLHKISLHEKLLHKLREFGLEFPIISTRPVLYFNKASLAKAEEFYRVPPHQDWRSMQGSLNSMVVWLPLADISEELGALKVVPGSHKYGLLESKENAWYRQIDEVKPDQFESVEVETGDALFFSAFLVHASGNNVTDRIRWSCHFRYNDLNEKTFIERGYVHPYIYKPVQDLLTPDFPDVDQIREIFD